MHVSSGFFIAAAECERRFKHRDKKPFAVLDGRTFVFLPYDDYGRSKIYEIGADGAAIERGDTLGDVFKWVKIR